MQQLERKVARLQGERSNEEKVALNAKIKARVLLVWLLVCCQLTVVVSAGTVGAFR